MTRLLKNLSMTLIFVFVLMTYAANAFELAPKYVYGYMDTKGQILVQPAFQQADDFSEDLAAVAVTEGGSKLKYGYIDKSGKFAIKARYDNALMFSENLAAVDINGRRGFIDKTGKMIISPDFQGGINLYSKFVNGLAPVRVSGSSLCGYIQKDGKLKIKDQYDDALPFSDGLAAVQSGGKWGFIDVSGRYVIKPKFESARNFAGGLAPVAVAIKSDYNPGPPLFFLKGILSQLWGYSDKSGTMVIKPTFVYAWPFSDGLASVISNDFQHGDQFYYINSDGSKATERKLLRGKPFSEGLAAVYLPNTLHWCFMDKKGRITNTEADYLSSPTENIACFGIRK